ncbi:uncharacterized protein LOC126903852 [Daktulosphaira vitifoliae]|uniref:uncharacterized protein LOC126903852 n=1 Tax=Daktulosphaira vitifoliae TaxID=58002 RepID=UPI0021A9E073|nr:uncharacterized protein LOC126903852 [Daktulosphaira vitifoliae]
MRVSTTNSKTVLNECLTLKFRILVCLLSVQWLFVNSTFAISPGEVKVTLPSRNEATNPLKEPTPSTLQGAFISQNSSESGNGSPTPSTTDFDPPKLTTNASTTTVKITTKVPAKTSVEYTSTVVTQTGGQGVTSEVTLVTTKPSGNMFTIKGTPFVDSTTTESSVGDPTVDVTTVEATTVESTTVESKRVDDGTTMETPSQFAGVTTSKNDFDSKSLAKMLKSWFNVKGDDQGDYYKLTKYLKNASTSKSSGKNVFDQWDEASEEQERMLEEAMRNGDPESSVLAADQNTPSRWFVLLLTGNSTVAQMRRTDFAKYLKLNLAARLSVEYNEVQINRILVVPPRLMVNVSVVPIERADDNRIEEDPLHNLVETNATLMELSGEEYRVERFMSLKSHKPQSLEDMNGIVSNRHGDIDSFIFFTVGPLCVLIILIFVFLSLYKYIRKHPVKWPWKRKIVKPSFKSPWLAGGQRHHRMDESVADEGSSVNVIYSGEFEQSQQQQLSGSWLDDANFVPDDSLDRIRTPTLLQRPSPKNKAFSDLLCENGASAAAVSIVQQSPRLSRENKLRILGCKQSCLLLPPQPVQQQNETDSLSPLQNSAVP